MVTTGAANGAAFTGVGAACNFTVACGMAGFGAGTGMGVAGFTGATAAGATGAAGAAGAIGAAGGRGGVGGFTPRALGGGGTAGGATGGAMGGLGMGLGGMAAPAAVGAEGTINPVFCASFLGGRTILTVSFFGSDIFVCWVIKYCAEMRSH